MAQLANDSAYGALALKFARALADNRVDTAYAMLSSGTRSAMSKEDLAEQYQDMISYGDGPANLCEVMIVDDDMPKFGAHDLAWVYVAICGPGFSEAVAVVVVDEGHTTAIRLDSWGRP
jgi:hypothetical protein